MDGNPQPTPSTDDGTTADSPTAFRRVESETTPPTESSHLRPVDRRRSYGTLPGRHTPLPPQRALSFLHNLRRVRSNSISSNALSPSRLQFARISTRPISTYDEPIAQREGEHTDADIKVNGVRVWYSSFTSIDWLHDTIKASARFSRLRRRRSLRSRIRLVFDRGLGWFIVTIVGFLTAVVAFFVVRSEQVLFDFKEGYCSTGWWKAKRFCCPSTEGGGLGRHIFDRADEGCHNWATWAEVYGNGDDTSSSDAVEYISYSVIALSLALVSCLLTIYLTNSTTFITRKELVADEDIREYKGVVPEPKRKVMYYAAGSGIPEIKTILSGFVIHGYLGGRTLFTKAVGLSLSVASGLSLGKEGPFVHIASCVGNIISRLSGKYENNEAKRREILSAACAAGVAVAFGAPIGGTLFSLEEVSYFFPPKVMWRSFFCAMIAAITLKILDPFGTGKLVLFQVTYDKDWHAYELVPFLLLSVFGGIYGAWFSKLNHRWSRDVRNKTFLGPHPVVEVLLITLVTSMLCFLNPFTRMGGTELIYNLFAECRTGSRNTHSGLCVVDPGSFTHAWPVLKSILVAMLVKGGLTVITFGIKLPAGIFIPTLGVGACAGRFMGICMQWFLMNYPDFFLFRSCHGNADCIIPGLYAMVGAAATLSGVTRTTVSLAVIMFELTDTLTYAVPIMLSVLVAKTVADALEPKGIYDLVIELNQLPYLDAKHQYLWGSLQIDDVVSRDVQVIRSDRKNTGKSLKELVSDAGFNQGDDGGFPILRSSEHEEGLRLVGYIGVNELGHGLRLVEEMDHEIRFGPAHYHNLGASSISSLQEDGQRASFDVFDFTLYMDQAPLTLSNNSPMELVHQLFVKLGARYVVITDSEGLYEGIIDKKTWLAFLSDLEHKS